MIENRDIWTYFYRLAKRGNTSSASSCMRSRVGTRRSGMICPMDYKCLTFGQLSVRERKFRTFAAVHLFRHVQCTLKKHNTCCIT
jgi:hypothetical protein